MFVFVFVVAAAVAALSTICCAAKAAPGERTNGKSNTSESGDKSVANVNDSGYVGPH